MSLKLIGKKLGMTQVFDKDGNVVVCTIIQADTNFISQIKKKETDGYNALQIASIKKKNPTKPMQGHFKKNNLEPCRHILETSVDNIEEFTIGQEFNVDYFEKGEYVDIIGTSKGKGFQGLMKKYGFAGMPASHGCSRSHRLGGSTGMRSTPGRCFPGGKRASRMGGERKTIQSLPIVDVDLERKLIIVKGSVPGSANGLVYITRSIKKINTKSKKK